MSKTYAVLENIWMRYRDGKHVDIESDVLGLLLMHGIKIRQLDGELTQINLSIPTTIESAFVIGLC